MKIKTAQCSGIAFACLALTAFTVASGGTDKKVPNISAHTEASGTKVASSRTKPTIATSNLGESKGPHSKALASPGVGRADLSSLGFSGEGLPNLTVENIRSLKVGDPISIATPDGGSMDFIVQRRAWTGIDEKQIYT